MPLRGGLQPSLTVAASAVRKNSGRNGETALSRTEKRWLGKAVGRYYPCQTARRLVYCRPERPTSSMLPKRSPPTQRRRARKPPALSGSAGPRTALPHPRYNGRCREAGTCGSHPSPDSDRTRHLLAATASRSGIVGADGTGDGIVPLLHRGRRRRQWRRRRHVDRSRQRPVGPAYVAQQRQLRRRRPIGPAGQAVGQGYAGGDARFCASRAAVKRPPQGSRPYTASMEIDCAPVMACWIRLR